MDDKDFSVEDILNDVNSKNSAKDTELTDLSFNADTIPNNSYSNKSIDELLNMNTTEEKSETIHTTDENSTISDKKDEVDLLGLEDLLKPSNAVGDAENNANEKADDEKPKNKLAENFGKAETVSENDEVKKADKKVSKKSGGKNKKKKKSHFNGSIFGGIILVTVILTVSMVLAVSGITIGMEYWGIGKSDNDISFNIPKGSSNDDIADLLVENGIIKNKKLFLLAMKIEKPETIYPGDITLHPSMGYSDVISELAIMRESYETVTLTFTEGETLLDIANKLEENGVCTAEDFLFEFNKNQGYEFEKKIVSNENTFYSMEGYFFPDTYDFYVGDTAYNITKIVREHFDSKITDTMYQKMDKLGMDLNEVMTLASIVQLEAASADQMPTVASVFINRLNDSDTFPMLQSDTTSNYIKNVISTQADNQTSIDHYTEYYDTYQCYGLPAGPICSPGIDAINAVLNAEKTDYYYFCNNLETGETFYAKTLEEHEENLKKAGLA